MDLSPKDAMDYDTIQYEYLIYSFIYYYSFIYIPLYSSLLRKPFVFLPVFVRCRYIYTRTDRWRVL